MITVPCCENCRAGWSTDDEYFWAAILSSSEAYEDPNAHPAIGTLLRGLSRPTKRGFARLLSESVEDVPVLTEAGIYLGAKPGFRLDKPRIKRVSDRIIRGLFFHEKGHPVPAAYAVTSSLQQFGVDEVFDALKGVQFPPVKSIQNDIFSYTLKDVEEDSNSTVWIAAFYRNLILFGFTTLPPEARGRRTDGL